MLSLALPSRLANFMNQFMKRLCEITTARGDGGCAKEVLSGGIEIMKGEG